MVEDAAELEAAYGQDAVPRGLLDLNAQLCEQFL